ncbi:MAG TPA: NUDIX domain-containing protein [Polyangiaceae bacterium]|nr:NUDIX domain-containing protein [Polyangiaceae bacterium]
MAKQSAGLVLYRSRSSELEVLLVHPGGPFWQRKDEHAWSIPKGELEDEEPLAAAKREVAEEIGVRCEGDFIPLGSLKQAGGKLVHAWAIEQDFDPERLHSNSFELEWPPKSGRMRSFPEVDAANWFTIAQARQKILKGQLEFLDRLVAAVGTSDAAL